MFDQVAFAAYLAHLSAVALSVVVLRYFFPCVGCCFSCLASALLCLQLCMFSFHLSRKWYFTEKISPAAKAVLITGCDSGFGHHLAKRMDKIGFHVFAACLLPQGDGASDLKRTCSENLQVLELDVRSDGSVKGAVEVVKQNLGPATLWAIVNNAGIFKGFCLDMCTIQDVKDTIDVNALGPVRVTKAFLPLLRTGKGRIVNVTSLGGRLPSPYMMPYCMSKYAAVAFTECLKQELDIWGIKIISIEPEAFRTPMVEGCYRRSATEAARNNLPDDIRDLYGEKYKEKLDVLSAKYCKSSSTNIDMVIDDIESAICLKYPSSVYKPCRNIFMSILVYVAERLPACTRDFFSLLYVRYASPSIK